MNQTSLIPVQNYHWQNIRLIATDMDGTLTQSEKFDAQLLQILARLAAAKIDVLITTGRSAGWVQAIATYLPVVGAMAENGGLIYWQQDARPRLIEELDLHEHRSQLAKIFKLLKQKFPQIEESSDNPFRLTDWTFEVENLDSQELEQIADFCQSAGYGFTYSTIQCHIKPLEQDKASGLQKIIPQYFSHLQPTEIVTIGDSPNDESMFNQQKFPLSVGVANVLKYRDRLEYLPAYVTNRSEGGGFFELAELILNARN